MTTPSWDRNDSPVPTRNGTIFLSFACLLTAFNERRVLDSLIATGAHADYPFLGCVGNALRSDQAAISSWISLEFIHERFVCSL
jgi:hypothetical protein